MSEGAVVKYIKAPLTAETVKDLHAGDVAVSYTHLTLPTIA